MQVLLSRTAHAIPEVNVIGVAAVNVPFNDLVNRQWPPFQQLLKQSRSSIHISLGKEQPDPSTHGRRYASPDQLLVLFE